MFLVFFYLINKIIQYIGDILHVVSQLINYNQLKILIFLLWLKILLHISYISERNLNGVPSNSIL